MTIENLEFYNEEIILSKIKIKEDTNNVFTNSGMNHERANYVKCKVVKIGKKQTEVKVGEIVLIDSNGFPKEITVAGFGTIDNHHPIMSHLRLFCKIDE